MGPLQFTPTKKCQSDNGVRGPKKHILEPILSTNMVQRSGKRGPMVGKRQGRMVEK